MLLLVLSRFSAGLFYREAAALEERFEYAVDQRTIAWSSTVRLSSNSTAASKAIELRQARPLLANSAGAILFAAELVFRCAITVAVLIALIGPAVVPLVLGGVLGSAIGVWSIRFPTSGRAKAMPSQATANNWLSLTRSPQERGEVASLGLTDLVLNKWRSAEQEADSLRSTADARAAAGWFLGQAVLGAGTALTLVWALNSYSQSEPVWLIAAVAVLIVQIQRQISSVTTTLGWIQGVLKAVESLESVGDTEHPRRRSEATDGGTATIKLANVSFSYPGAERSVLDSIDLRLHGGETIGITGPNGGGKSTLLAILTGELQPTSGTVRTHVESQACVFQDFARIGLSLRRSVELGRPDKPDQVHAAIDAAGLASVADELPLGIDTSLRTSDVPFGQDLSAGQWQRVAFARALNAYGQGSGLLALDEATRFMDSGLGSKVVGSLAEARRLPSSIVVMVSHRASELLGCDRVLIVRDGTIAEASEAELHNGQEWYVGN